MDGVPGELVKDDAIRVDQRMRYLKQLLEDKHEKPSVFEPGIAARYKREVNRLIDSLNSDDHREEASELIRALIDRIVLSPSRDRDRPIIDLEGDLAGILAVATGNDKAALSGGLSDINPDECEALVAGGRGKRFSPNAANDCEALVAGVGFEPTTFRL
ncbi:MAG: hypothetical protein AAFV31_04425 [Pseudomonadota bacterium]